MSALYSVLWATAIFSQATFSVDASVLNAELVWPEPQMGFDVTGRTELPEEERGVDSAYFPCHYVPVPEDVDRIPFPIQGGRIQLEFTSDTWSSDSDIDRSRTDWWRVSEIFGQFRGLNQGSEQVMKRLAQYHLFSSDWSLGEFCGDPMPAFDFVQEDTRLPPVDESVSRGAQYNVSNADLEGVEATLSIDFVYYPPETRDSTRDSTRLFRNCIYVRFTSEAVTGPCAAISSSSSSAPTVPATSVPTALGRPGDSEADGGSDRDEEIEDEDDEPASGAPGDPTTSNDADGEESPIAGGEVSIQESSSNSSVVGIAAGVSSAVGIAIVVLVFWLVRRRRARRRGSSTGSDVSEQGMQEVEEKPQDTKKIDVVQTQEDEKPAMKCDLIMVQEAIAAADVPDKTGKGKKPDDAADDGISTASVYSEPLPVYEAIPKK